MGLERERVAVGVLERVRDAHRLAVPGRHRKRRDGVRRFGRAVLRGGGIDGHRERRGGRQRRGGRVRGGHLDDQGADVLLARGSRESPRRRLESQPRGHSAGGVRDGVAVGIAGRAERMAERFPRPGDDIRHGWRERRPVADDDDVAAHRLAIAVRRGHLVGVGRGPVGGRDVPVSRAVDACREQPAVPVHVIYDPRRRRPVRRSGFRPGQRHAALRRGERQHRPLPELAAELAPPRSGARTQHRVLPPVAEVPRIVRIASGPAERVAVEIQVPVGVRAVVPPRRRQFPGGHAPPADGRPLVAVDQAAAVAVVGTRAHARARRFQVPVVGAKGHPGVHEAEQAAPHLAPDASGRVARRNGAVDRPDQTADLQRAVDSARRVARGDGAQVRTDQPADVGMSGNRSRGVRRRDRTEII